ncbi:hypothetical protein wVul_1121 [Wolbachia endosymbiont of Armadillidium vulgare str. wVulC]|nr:hypothetical protein wVul_1121 [Wolbachia endosymbiont of Armadillidium vulgare str. wVulC]OJH31549.1 hypothetical protein Wxf_00941 [Wolbachia endosymbiont of Armadillidium vulgare]OJH32229.1 hypothetical protein Wxf_01656 [Wolbachia endosymbiont of Armadillidium vulgare]OJH32974.1 hypothetical protein Wxf_02438 [Wolbachia endosymbiont of Armadillidium vulgare]RDD35267.1 hypothetical protein Wcon_00586 [Wolbachia endosymbiont of Cylisticus convexus]
MKEESIDVNAKNIMKQTPLDLADILGYKDIVGALKAKEEGIDITDKNENIPLLMTDKETQSDKLNLLDKDESDIQQLSDDFSFEQFTQSDQLL